MTDVYRSYTRAEKRERARLLIRGAKQALAGAEAIDPRFERRLDAIDARAEDRGRREAAALRRQYDKAQDDLAAARAAERAAKWADRATAKQARKQAERRVRDTERAIRRAGLA
ncbi:hypothetical protein RKE29_03735 [Streptomyces sp. B1866]|uniref:hypothetical protein n=1 Tax=Streptomyces sp. B1866 TaxID=3075431 RepID=UPI00288FE97D|nr:hypothetical protein [Streptomyces sp. B1866]MDT3395767.1 hypothetical protein [Streptomyces sp. B1866]